MTERVRMIRSHLEQAHHDAGTPVATAETLDTHELGELRSAGLVITRFASGFRVYPAGTEHALGTPV